MSECLVYYLKEGVTRYYGYLHSLHILYVNSQCDGFIRVGRHDAELTQDIQLSGLNIMDQHCVFENTEGKLWHASYSTIPYTLLLLMFFETPKIM